MAAIAPRDVPPDSVTPLTEHLRLAGFQGPLSTERTFEKLTTYRLGGPLACLAEPLVEGDFPALGAILHEHDLPHFFIGGGTNLLAASRFYPGIVIKLGEGYREIDPIDDTTLRIGGATSTAAVLKYCQRATLGGLEMLAGVPGTLGGAVAMNAGTMKDWLERSLISVTAVDPDWTVHALDPIDCGLRYRGSRLLDEGWRVLSATFRVSPGMDIGPHVRDHLTMRRRTQPGGRNAGSNFKNPPGQSAGALIDQAGCKGWREGGAVVSELHANFLLAETGCTAEDVFALMQRVARQVELVHGVRLEPEVVLLNFATPWTATWEEGGAP